MKAEKIPEHNKKWKRLIIAKQSFAFFVFSFGNKLKEFFNFTENAAQQTALRFLKSDWHGVEVVCSAYHTSPTQTI